MDDDAQASADEPSPTAERVLEQAEPLCRVQDHITRVIAHLDLPMEEFTDQSTKKMPWSFEFEPMVRVFLYWKVCGFGQQEVADRLAQWPYLQLRFGLDRAPTQPSLSNFERSRLTLDTRSTLTDIVHGLREIGAEHDVLGAPNRSPPVDVDEVQDKGPTAETVDRAVNIARMRLFPRFATERAANAKYADEVFWELQAYLTMGEGGRKTKRRATRRSMSRAEMPHKDTHTRAVKLISSPDPQTTLDDYESPDGPEQWQRIRTRLLQPFQRAIDTLIEETNFTDQIREPVNVAIDVTPWRFWPSPWKHYDQSIPKEDFPKMVSGLKGKHERGYKFATLTVVGRDTPFILAMEPVKENSMWEDGTSNTPREEVVKRLIEKARKHVDINKVMADSAYDNNALRDYLDAEGLTYIIPKPRRAAADKEVIRELEAEAQGEYAVSNDVPLKHNGRIHDVDFIYAPPNRNSSEYKVFTTNADVPLERAPGLVAQYSDRWTIENEYKTIKSNYLPKTNSKDYRVRLFYFVAAVLMYNTWRLTNVLIRNWYDVHLGEAPPVPAGEISETLFDRAETGVG